MPSPMFNVRGAHAEDANELLDIDIKCFENPWPAEMWSRVGHLHEYAISAVTYFGSPVGFAVFRDTEQHDTEIVKLAVLKPHRRRGASHYLLAAVVEFAQRYRSRELVVVVPESTIYPGPNNTSGWLSRVGFSATKPFLKNHFDDYGTVEDGVKFTAPIRRLVAG